MDIVVVDMTVAMTVAYAVVRLAGTTGNCAVAMMEIFEAVSMVVQKDAQKEMMWAV